MKRYLRKEVRRLIHNQFIQVLLRKKQNPSENKRLRMGKNCYEKEKKTSLKSLVMFKYK